MTNPPPITRLGAQHSARHELAKGIYHRQADPLPVRIIKWVNHQLDKLVSKGLSHAPTGSFGALALVVLIAVIAALIVWRVGPLRRAGTLGAVLDGAATIESASEHRIRAEQAADAAEFTTAIIERMRATARELEERGILDARAGRTASELSREAGVVIPVAAAALDRAADTFNSVAYGGGDADRHRYDVMVEADDAVLRSSRSMAVPR